ncbi:MAG: helix-turn-helix transcriptional regulator [Clostridia bacterium]|nr:helix-turn-helix transcriptional regulator [Clostridia bacterium]
MNKNFIITSIEQVILVGKEKYKEKNLHFSNSIPFNEIIFHFSGSSIVYFGEQSLKVKENTVRFLPKGKVSRYDVHREIPGECIDVFFSTDKPVSENAFVWESDKKEQIGALFRKLFICWTSKSDGYYMKCMSYLYRIIAEIQSIEYVSIEQYNKITPAIDEINREFLNKSLSSSYLAEICGISETYLKKLFNKKFGIPPKKYIIQKKIDYACELLLLRRYTVTEIAEMCNFGDVYYFSRQFKEYMGVSPLEYIKRVR